VSETPANSRRTFTVVGRRLPNGKWPAERHTVEVISEHDTVKDAATACHDAATIGRAEQ
jgi:hypothetical protein